MSRLARTRISADAQELFFAGGDLSLTATGFVIMNQYGEVKERHVIKVKTKGAQRLCDIQAAVRNIIAPYKIKQVCLEGYARSTINGREEAGEIGGAIRMLLYRMNTPYKAVAPTSLKKFVTGAGGGDAGSKDQVTMHVYKHWAFQAIDNNEADAAALCRVALAMHGYGGNLLPYQREALNVILNPPIKKKKKKKNDIEEED